MFGDVSRSVHPEKQGGIKLGGTPEFKRCTICGEEKPLDEFYKGSGVGGRLARCKVCISRSRREKYQNDPTFRQKAIERQRGYNLQPGVKERQKEWSNEYRNRPEVKERVRNYLSNPSVKKRRRENRHNPDTIERNREAARGYYQRNITKVKEYKKAYLQRCDVKGRLKEYYSDPRVKERRAAAAKMRRQRAEVKKQIHEYQQRPEVKERRSVYFKSSRSKFLKRNREHLRRSRKINAIVTTDEPITQKQWEEIIKHQKNKCPDCGMRFTKKNPPTMDHIVPLSVFPLHSSDNIRAVCARCNAKKCDKLVPNYIQSWIYTLQI